MDSNGTLDLEDELLEQLDYAIASMHAQNYRPGSCAENTQAFTRAMENPHVKLLGHCDHPLYPVDYDTLVACAKEHHVLLEINEASLAPYGYRGDTSANNLELLSCCIKYQAPILLSSDSHGIQHIGDFTYSSEFVHQAMGDTSANNLELLSCCIKYQAPILLSSDSHGIQHIGDFTYSSEFVHQAMFPEHLIYNNQLPRLKVFLQEHI